MTSEAEIRIKLVRSRAVLKGKITHQFALMSDDNSAVNVANCKKLIDQYLSQIGEFDSKLIDLFDADFSEEAIPDEVSAEIDKQADYITGILNKLSSFTQNDSPNPVNNDDIKSVSDCKLKLPELKCDSFSGEGTSQLEFHSFISQFNNIIGLRTNLTDATKLTYLRTYLKGYAFKLIQHLQITNSNYEVCLGLLKSEFLNENTIVDDLIKKLLEIKPKHDLTFHETKVFLGEIRCLISDLGVYNFDFMTEKAANKLVSHIVFNKLPSVFQQELVRRLNDNYPSIQSIFDNYVEVIRTLNLNSVKPKSNIQQSVDFVHDKNINHSHKIVSRSTTVTKHNGRDVSKFCKFCTSPGHNMLNCERYVGFQSRKKRCIELKICANCSSQRHKAADCNRPLDFPCYRCNSKSHITALCDKVTNSVSANFCINSSNSVGSSGKNFLLPIVKLKLNVRNSNIVICCLLDTGSQRSYISNRVMEKLNVDLKDKTKLLINTFIDSNSMEFTEVAATVELDGKNFVIPFLVNDEFDLNLTISGLKEAHHNISKSHMLQEKFLSDNVVLDGLIGVDVLQCIKQLELVPCLGGSAFRMASGIVPFGNVDSFLNRQQLQGKYSQLNEYMEDCVDSATVNFVLNPVKIGFDPVGQVIADSSVDDRLDEMFSLESLGITDETSDFDAEKIAQFESNIIYKDGSYGVNIPWNDKIEKVPNNYNVALAILNRVLENLNKDKLYDTYHAVILQQLSDGILEEISIDDIEISDHVFVPHRPVVKMESNVTTKVRLVLNCSMKLGSAPSLNEAVYTGVDLVNNLLQLLIKIRANQYLALSDIKAAFLMIKLNLDSDKNKFTILWKVNGKLVAYRYKTIVFGLASSPFILQQVIIHHLENYQNDKCNKILKRGMYVDNLFYTDNNVNSLISMYRETYDRMKEGGFVLRSWCSNSPELCSTVQEDGLIASPDCDWQKLLGYRYFPADDCIMLNTFDTKAEVFVTKRTILSYCSRIFDPMGLILPIIVMSKLLIRKLWSLKLEWDEQISADLMIEWIKIKNNLDLTQGLRFDRFCYSGKLTLIVCCDSSKSMYGFCCYVRGEASDYCNLIFAKTKNAPNKSKSIPTLELLSVYLALRCLPTVLETLDGMVVDVVVCIDAQVVLSWVLSECVKSKNICARNRVKDITKLRQEIKTNHNVECKFKYIPTDQNPADMVTRGISFKEYGQKLDFWLHGPSFFLCVPEQWPDRELGCLSDDTKILSLNVIADRAIDSVVQLDSFSCFNRLLRVTTLVIKFGCLTRKIVKSDVEHMNSARIHLIKTEQSKFLGNEISFLKNQRDKNVPSLVRNLNLFLDESGILRSRGRISQSIELNTEVNNPILLPRKSWLTSLIIEEVHLKCKHYGMATTLLNFRKRGYWVSKGRITVKTVLSKCIVCKKINGNSFKYPKTNDYLSDKVNFVTAYEHVGIDFTGHVLVKLGDSLSKMYILVFTCLNVRAIHLELLSDMSCANFLMAFVRFSNRYRIPAAVYSDNASTFLMALGILSDSFTDNEFSEHLVSNNIRHVKIPLYAAWAGSAWERMIRTLKSALHKAVGRRHLCYFQLITLLSDLENCINSRPLTYLNNDVELNCITPNSFLKFDTGNNLVIDGAAGGELIAPRRSDLVKSLQLRDDLFQKAKDVWIEEYLVSLREAGRDVYQANWENKVSIGDVVLISSPVKPRPLWTLGRVVKLLPGKDGIVRTVTVIRPDRSEGVYPINLLYPLELSVDPVLIDDETDGESPPDPIRSRPKRDAAIKCLDRIRNSN